MSKRQVLEITRAGNPILRESMPKIPIEDISSPEIQELIENMRYTNEQTENGIAIAAPQVGARKALGIIGIQRPGKQTKPEYEGYDRVIINPTYEGIGRRVGMWEGCLSIGSGDDTLYGMALRYKEVDAEWYDEKGKRYRQILKGFLAHIYQHEVDHLNGILFVDRVRDTKTFIMQDEYRAKIKE